MTRPDTIESRERRFFWFVLGATFLARVWVSHVFVQKTGQANISGVVTDQSGAVESDTTVTAAKHVHRGGHQGYDE